VARLVTFHLQKTETELIESHVDPITDPTGAKKSALNDKFKLAKQDGAHQVL
jgi:hypothetical protein